MNPSSLRILVRGSCSPQSDWLNAALASLGHRVHAEQDQGADVLLVHDARCVSAGEVRARRKAGALTLLRAWHDPETFEAHRDVAPCYDWVLTTGLAEMVTLYSRVGARAIPLFPSAPPCAQDAFSAPRDLDIIFAGRLDGPERRHRLEFLHRAQSRWRVATVRNGDDIAALHRRARIALHMDCITLNRYGVTRRCAATRPFCGPAFGCALLTELQPWLAHCYDPAGELAAFRDVDDAIDRAAALLGEPSTLDSIARSGAARCLGEHQAVHRARQLGALATEGVPLAMRVLALGPWYQSIELPDGSRTSLLMHSNVERWQRLAACFPDVHGRSVLDLGMNAGFFSLQCARRGASRVVGVDASPLACAQARFVFDVCGTPNVEVVEGDITAAPEGPFDVCLALALLHHEPEASRLLQLATRRARMLVLEWEVRPAPWFHPVEEVCSILERLNWRVEVCARGPRPIAVANAA